jgi:hypothetical protein
MKKSTVLVVLVVVMVSLLGLELGSSWLKDQEREMNQERRLNQIGSEMRTGKCTLVNDKLVCPTNWR